MPRGLRMAAFAAAAALALGAPTGGYLRSSPSRPLAPGPAEFLRAVAGVRLAPISPVIVDVSRLPTAKPRPGARSEPGEEEYEPEELARRLLPRERTVPPGARILLARPSAVAMERVAESAPPPAPQVQFGSLGDDGVTSPPDTDGAVGPSHVVTMLNAGMRIQDRSGVLIRDVALSTFWGSSRLSDPSVLYDAPAGRWIATILSITGSFPSKVLLAVSQSDDPTGQWAVYEFSATTNGGFLDFPRLGLSANRIVVEVNLFTTFRFVGSSVLVFDKAALYAGQSTPPTLIQSSTLGPTLVPSVTQEPGRTEVFLLQNYNGRASEGGLLELYALTGELGAESLEPIAFPGSPERWAFAFDFGSDLAPQKGSDNGFDTVDARMGNVVLRRGFLWAVHTIFDPPVASPSRSLIQWWQIALDGRVAGHGRFEDPGGAFLAFPSIAVNRDDHVVVGFAIFSPDQYGSGGFAYRSAADPDGLLRGPVVLKTGEDPYVWFHGGDARNRWGDYSATITDPVDDTSFWTIQEYAAPQTVTPPQTSKKSHWGTWWGAIEPDLPFRPSAHFESAAEKLSGWPLEFRDVSGGGPIEWSWSFGDGTSSSEKNPIKAFAAPGTYVISLTASNRAGSSSETQSITVLPAPARAGPEPAAPRDRNPVVLPPRR
ncbi:MAG TPA: PKD domain-containing protein [Thermoanaerobaculia bacterium]